MPFFLSPFFFSSAAAEADLQPLPPPVPHTTTQRELNSAYQATQTARGPGAIAAQGAYAAAINAYRSGDPVSARNYATWAQVQLNMQHGAGPVSLPTIQSAIPQSNSFRSSPVTAPDQPAPAARPFSGLNSPLPAAIVRARSAVFAAKWSNTRERDRAYAALRDAVDAWVSGNEAAMQKGADTAQALARGA